MRTATAVTVLLLGILVCAQATQYAFEATFVHREAKFGAGSAAGKMYFRYDTGNTANNVVRYDYTSPTKVSVIKVQADKRIYKRCGNECEGSGVESMSLPPLMYDSSIYNGKCSLVSGRYECTGTGTLSKVVFMSQTNGEAPLEFTLKNGKTYTLDNRNTHSFNDVSVFKVQESWDCGHCVTMIDMFFLLDISGSIDCDEWKTVVKFVKTILGKFTLSETSTAASIILWSTKVKVPWPLNHYQYLSVMDPNKGALKCSTSGSTRQYLGFVELINQLNENSTVKVGYSRRKHGKHAPTVVALVVTDGYDDSRYYEGLAKGYANVIKNKYNGHVIEVGVGKWVKQSFLEEVASKFDGKPAVERAETFDDLQSLTDKIVQKSCSWETGEEACKSGCQGFCGCKAKCYCPVCDATNDKCLLNECSTDGITATKCVKRDVDCLTNTNKCIIKSCDKTTGKCSQTNKDCPAKKTPNNKVCKCGTVYCNPSSDCQYSTNPSLCPAKNCKVIAGCNCDADGVYEDAPGCIYKDRVCTSSVACLGAKCNPANNQCETYSTCPVSTNKCEPNVCNKATGKCVVDKLVEKCAAKKCHHVSCDPKTGGCVYTPYNCSAMNKETNACIKWWCDEASGKCMKEQIPNCVPCEGLQCPVKACYITKCIKNTEGKPECKLEPRENNCTRGLCERGRCNENSEDVNEVCQYESVCPEGNACFEPVCQGRLVCNLVPRTDVCLGNPCEINGKCVDNTTGQCVYESPCKKRNCMNVTCKINGNKAECPEVPYDGCTVSEAYKKCMTPFCNVTTDQCETKPVNCDDDDVCTVDTCDLSVGCVHTPEVPDTICHYAVCDPNKSEGERWTYVGKCDDGLYCTKDYCDYSTGECSHSPNLCLDLPMDDYPCFTPKCTESKQCRRKLVPDAYIDICGRCILPERFKNESESSSSSVDVDEECMEGMGINLPIAGITGGVVAAIVIAVVIVVAGLTASSIYGTKELMKRARNAADQGAQMNPLYEDSKHEASNPFYEDSKE